MLERERERVQYEDCKIPNYLIYICPFSHHFILIHPDLFTLLLLLFGTLVPNLYLEMQNTGSVLRYRTKLKCSVRRFESVFYIKVFLKYLKFGGVR